MMKEEFQYVLYYIVYTNCSIAGEVFTILDATKISAGKQWCICCHRENKCKEENQDCWIAGGKGEPFDFDEMIDRIRKEGECLPGEASIQDIDIYIEFLRENQYDSDKVILALQEATGLNFDKKEDWIEWYENIP